MPYIPPPRLDRLVPEVPEGISDDVIESVLVAYVPRARALPHLISASTLLENAKSAAAPVSAEPPKPAGWAVGGET